jgi:hypothetical protein
MIKPSGNSLVLDVVLDKIFWGVLLLLFTLAG